MALMYISDFVFVHKISLIKSYITTLIKLSKNRQFIMLLNVYRKYVYLISKKFLSPLASFNYNL
jgi:hypothetical protein